LLAEEKQPGLACISDMALPVWFKKSSFLRQCAGKTIELTLKYRLEGLRSESPDNQVVIKFPDTFEITAHPPILHQTID
jgi:hypothetical protein